MLNVKKLLTKMLTWMNMPLAVTSTSQTSTVSSGGAFSVVKSVTKSGYYPVGIVGINMSGTNSGYGVPRSFFLDNVQNGSATVTAYITNRGTSSNSWTVTFYVLWVKLGGVVKKLLSALTPERGWASC